MGNYIIPIITLLILTFFGLCLRTLLNVLGMAAAAGKALKGNCFILKINLMFKSVLCSELGVVCIFTRVVANWRNLSCDSGTELAQML